MAKKTPEERTAAALERIATCLERILTSDEPHVEEELPPAVTVCEHPQDQRQSLSSMGDPEEFFCKACKQHVVLEAAHG